ncbi:hypothetical protein S13b_00074 [Klebsiella phage VLCpiS13b]|uniref:hypothetical protein n=1 Tax=Klebsiella phage VLCpiS13b TaxID=2874886 RepID=UPI00233F3D18|nr:hypothetical protein PRB92_gp51 [Klebsiella phage VLCpiS13b]UVX30649.1 hypothetical protein S13b_00074 [Klebsiella phage VLCpiS13b]
MDIEIKEVQEIIKNLESSGELSIKEEKYLNVAKLCVQLTAENVALKDINAWCKTDAFKNMSREFKTAEALGCSNADCMHDAMLVAIMHAPATPTTDRIVAGFKADGVEEFAAKLRIPGDDQFFDALAKGVALAADDFAKQLREGADK